MFGGGGMRLGAIAGIPLRVHFSWLIALALMTSSLSVELAPSAGRAAPVVALLTALVLFASLVAHELGHSLVARRRGVGVSAITLFVFGGVASLDAEPKRPRDELAIAVAGPVVSVLVGAGALLLARAGLPPILSAPLAWLGRVNLGIAAFNLLPGFPLDGGRILRGVLWAVRGDAYRATMGATRVGRGIAYGLITLGVVRALVGSIGDGFWIGLLGWFLLTAARSATLDAELRAALGHVRIGDVMIPEAPILRSMVQKPELPAFDWRSSMLDAFARLGDAPFALVTDGERVVGVVDREHLAAIVRTAALRISAEGGGTRWARGAQPG